MLAHVGLVCFFSCYALALALEISRLYFRMSVRLIVIVALAGCGLLLHAAFLYHQAAAELATGPIWSSWRDWNLLAAWALAAVYLALAASRPQASAGLFLLPIILALIALAYALRNLKPVPRDQAVLLWGLIHGVLLMLGAAAVSLGFVAGLLYLVQSNRLKNKLPPRPGFKLPALEWLQRVNKHCLLFSSGCLALGLVAGVALNLVKHTGAGPLVPWSDPVIVTSSGLLAWLLAAMVFEFTYKPAQQGRKVAYLTMASFVFLAIVVGLLAAGASDHTRAASQGAGAPSGAAP